MARTNLLSIEHNLANRVAHGGLFALLGVAAAQCLPVLLWFELVAVWHARADARKNLIISRDRGNAREQTKYTRYQTLRPEPTPQTKITQKQQVTSITHAQYKRII